MQSRQKSMVFRSAPVRQGPKKSGGPKFKIGAVEIVIITALVAGGAGFIYVTPFITLMQFRQAIDKRDSAGLSKHVDYCSLREGIKRQIYEQLARGRKSDGKVPLGSVIYADIAESAIDWIITPQGIALMMGDLHAYDQPWDNTSEGTKKLFELGEKSPGTRMIMDRYRKKPAEQDAAVKKEPAKIDSAMKQFTFTMGWTALDTFTVRVAHKSEPAQVTRLFFVRKGIKWILSGASIPPDKELMRLAEESEKESPAQPDQSAGGGQSPESESGPRPEGSSYQGN
jgi:hypothetical protein